MELVSSGVFADVAQTTMHLSIRGADAGIIFLIDSFSLRQGEVLVNPGFEQSIGSNNWYCSVCTGTLVSDAYAGSSAFQASGR